MATIPFTEGNGQRMQLSAVIFAWLAVVCAACAFFILSLASSDVQKWVFAVISSMFVLTAGGVLSLLFMVMHQIGKKSAEIEAPFEKAVSW